MQLQGQVNLHVFFCKKLVYKEIVLRLPKSYEILVLCLRSAKKLLKVGGMNIITNRWLNLYSCTILTNHLCFNITEHCLFLYDVLNVKKHICSSVRDHIENSAFRNTGNKETN